MGSAMLLAGSTLAFADSVNGTILAFDRQARIIVMTDNTVWSLEDADAQAPEGLKAGDQVEIVWDSLAEDGRGLIQSITLSNN
jgi:hypothetical protein